MSRARASPIVPFPLNPAEEKGSETGQEIMASARWQPPGRRGEPGKIAADQPDPRAKVRCVITFAHGSGLLVSEGTWDGRLGNENNPLLTGEGGCVRALNFSDIERRSLDLCFPAIKRGITC